MHAAYAYPPPPAAAPPLPGAPSAQDVARLRIRDILSGSAAFRSLPLAKQQQIARDTAQIATYLAAPEGIPAPELARQDPYALSLADGDEADLQFRTGDGSKPGENQQDFRAEAAREGAAVAGALLNQINFVDFVSGLIDGVFNSIVDSSIKQMEAYGELVANVSKSLSQFRDENVSANQGRDHLVERFPDLFEISVDTGSDFFGEGGGGPRVTARQGVDESEALRRVNESGMPLPGGRLDSLDDETIETVLVTAARNDLAKSRQQLLATMVTMGINRIVVTDGKIHAKVLYDFQARDNFQRRKSATQFDYGDQYTTTSEGSYERDTQEGGYEYERGSDGAYRGSSTGGKRWSKGEYKSTSTPVLKLASATQEASEGQLQTRASLAGVVEVNFKSDHIPLDRIADNFQIGMIQAAATPGNGATGGRGVVPGNAGGGSTGTASAPPAA